MRKKRPWTKKSTFFVKESSTRIRNGDARFVYIKGRGGGGGGGGGEKEGDLDLPFGRANNEGTHLKSMRKHEMAILCMMFLAIGGDW